MTQVDLLPEGESRLLDRYQLIGTIARGGMGSVSLARLAGVGGFQRLVAIKQLHPHFAQEQEFVDMFLDEARLAAGIHHQNVVSILEIGSSEDGLYLVMEYIEGASLARLAVRAHERGRTIPRPIAFRVLLDALAGLHAAHELTDAAGLPINLVHRDVSPQNVLVGVDGATKITDFGVARASSRLATTREGSFKGKLAYMAPEQTQGEELDRRADVFSVGIMLWELLAQRRLFRGKTDAETLNRLLHEPIPRLRQVSDSIHPALDALCAKALERDPSRRFQTAEQMAHALEQVARVESADAERYSIALVRSVASFVTDLIGDDIMDQRESVRSWLTRASTPSGAEASPSLRRAAGEESSGVGMESAEAATRVSDETTLPRTVRSVEMSSPRRRSTWLLVAAGCAAVLAVAWWLGTGSPSSDRGVDGSAASTELPGDTTTATSAAGAADIDGAPAEGAPPASADRSDAVAGGPPAVSSTTSLRQPSPPTRPPARSSPMPPPTSEPATSEPTAPTASATSEPDVPDPTEPPSNPYR